MEQNVNTIWSGLNDHLQGFISKKVLDKDTAQDIVQDVFLKFQTKIGTLKDEEKVTSWIFQIARNAINDHYRKQQRTMSEELGDEDLKEEVFEVDETKELSRCVSHMISSLPEKYKEALMLSEMEGLSQKELADKLGISYSGAKSRVQRGREKLKELFLQCCTISADKYGNIIEYQKKDCSDNC